MQCPLDMETAVSEKVLRDLSDGAILESVAGALPCPIDP